MDVANSEGAIRQRCISLVEAIFEKYGDSDSSDVPRSCGNSENSPAVFLKIKSTMSARKRDLIVLDEQNINTTGDLNRIVDLLESVSHLDLSKNQFDSWQALCEILCRCPLLQHCDLSYNSSSCVSICSNNFGLQLPKLKRLVLNGTQIPIKCLVDILQSSPCIEELHLSLNNYSSIQEHMNHLKQPLITFHTVHILHADQCCFNDWISLAALGSLFPCLEILVAAENPIEDAAFLDDPEKMKNHPENPDQKVDQNVKKIAQDVFGNLHCLNLNRWPIREWSSVDCLRFFPLLGEIRALGLPLFDGLNDDERRMLFIARLPDLTVLNGSAISKTQREDAERFFIRNYVDAPDRPERYYELVKIHGHLNKLLDLDLSPKSHAEIRLVHDDENRSEIRTVNLNQSVAQFKQSLRSFCDLPPNRIRLWYLDIEVSHVLGMDELRYPGVMLHALRVADGDEFHIQAKPEHCPIRKRTSGSTSSTQASPAKNN